MTQPRKRDWPQRNFRYAITEMDVPESLWEQARKMQTLWNQLAEAHQQVRSSINDEVSAEERKSRWLAFNELSQQLVRQSGLNWECGPDVLDRFNKSCMAAVQNADRGWPRAGGLKVSIPHRFTNGGRPAERLNSPRAKTFRLDTLNLFRPGRQTVSGVFTLDEAELRFQLSYHRPLPDGSFVKLARLTGRHSRAFGWTWFLTITVEEPPAAPRKPTERTCGLDLGWRKLPTGIRVGYLAGNQGETEELRLNFDFSTRDSRRQRARYPHWEHIPENYEELRELSSRRSQALNACKERIAQIWSTLPEGFVMMRARGLLRLLHDEQLPQDVRQVIEDWRDVDGPRFRTETRARTRFANRREDQYAKWAERLARAYDTIYIDCVGIKEMAEQVDKPAALQAAARYRQIAAPGELATELASACRKYGSQLVKMQPAGTTSICHLCGSQMTVGEKLLVTCPNGHAWDQDYNAAFNLLNQTTGVYTCRTQTRRERREVIQERMRAKQAAADAADPA